MRYSLLAALAATALVNGCTTVPYGYDYREQPPAYVDAAPYDRPAFDHRYERRLPVERYRYRHREEDGCGVFIDPRGCDPVLMAEESDRRKGPPPSMRSRAQPVPAPAARGEWRVQLGAFREQARAAGLRSRAAGTPALASHHTYLVKSAGLTRVQAGPLASAGDAGELCARVRASGYPCLVTRS